VRAAGGEAQLTSALGDAEQQTERAMLTELLPRIAEE